MRFRDLVALRLRRPRSGAFAVITTPESRRSQWKERDLTGRPYRRKSATCPDHPSIARADCACEYRPEDGA